MTDRDKLEILQSDIVKYLERLEKQLQTAIDGISDNAVSAETLEMLDDCIFSISCHADIFNGTEYTE